MLTDQQAITNMIMNFGGGWFFVFNGIGSVIVIVLTFFLAGWLLDRRKFVDFGFHFSGRWWADLGFGLFLGAILMVFIFLVELAFGWVTIEGFFQASKSSGFLSGMLAALVGFIAVGIYEEMLSRGYHLRNLAEGLNWKILSPRSALLIGYILSSSIFGLAHAINPNATLVSTLNLVLAGLFLGLGFVLTGELAISIGLHITWNFFQGNIFGFPVSGTNAGTSLITIAQGGSDLVTGGGFGPEAGLIGILAILLGSLLIILYIRQTRGAVRLHTAIAQYQKPAPKKQTGSEDVLEIQSE
jgi:membrane protease YdiL (CAAX protease family)